MVTPPKILVDTSDKILGTSSQKDGSASTPSASMTPATPATTTPAKNAPDTSAWLTRKESANLLGVSEQTIKNYEAQERLIPLHALRRDHLNREHRTVVHDPRELTKLHEERKEQALAKAKTKNAGKVDTQSWLTRNQAVDLMNVATQTLKNYEYRGMLHPLRVSRHDTRGHEQIVVVYDPRELAKLPRGNGRVSVAHAPGELMARSYELFNQGRSNREVVVELRETSDNVRMLRETWLDDGAAAVVISPEAKRALEALLGSFADVAELITLVKTRLNRI